MAGNDFPDVILTKSLKPGTVLIQEAQGISIFILFYFIFKLYIIVLVLRNIKMNPPQVYMCSPS